MPTALHRATLPLLLLFAFLFTGCPGSPSAPRMTGIDEATCEDEAIGGVWIGPHSSGFDCNCYDATCCTAIGDEPNVQCILD